jgi:NMD protein affecting ribosome stability and mRNA decay
MTKRICLNCGNELEKDDFQHHALCKSCHIKINGNFLQKLFLKIRKKLK